jgi:ribonuclease R
VAGAHCSANERRADEASRDVEAWLKCRFMREHLGEEYSGTVSAAASFGLFVTLDALYVDGLVHITELGGEYYRFDEARQKEEKQEGILRQAQWLHNCYIDLVIYGLLADEWKNSINRLVE